MEILVKITKRQLLRVIREATSAVEAGWTPWLEARGLGAEDLDDLAHFTGAPDRSYLDSEPPVDGMIGPADIESWAKNKTLKEGKVKITKRHLRRIIKEEISLLNEGVNPRGLKTLLKKLGVTRSYGGVTDALSTAFYEFEGDAADMKEEVEINSGGYRDDSGQTINLPLDVYQQIHDLYSKKKASYRAQRRY
jgi:hypothetical protein